MKSLIFVLLGLLTACTSPLPEDVAEAFQQLPDQLDFNVDVKPIISDKCFACHGPDRAQIKGGLQLHEAAVAFAPLPNSPGKVALSPGSTAKSEVYHRIISTDPEYLMPTPASNLALTAREKAVLIKWIEQGAKYEPHWAFQKPERQDAPDAAWPAVNDIDNFVFGKLVEKGLEPSQEANKELLLRRVSLDLTGLPPTLQEIDAFLADTSPDAYEKQVDRLLDSPHYGERMATDWMDLARFADTHGYTVDRYRDMSPWRDWVIDAFNENMGYDDFITWQLAGDLLPDATKEQILATGFNRLHPQNQEGGIVDEEFRVEYVADRTALFGQGFMGLTFSCARCHDHKFDPVSQKEFYELFSFFNNVNETGQISWDNATPVPTLMLPTEEQQSIITYLEEAVEKQEKELNLIETSEREAADSWINGGHYQELTAGKPTKGLIGAFPLDGALDNGAANSSGHMERMFSSSELPNFQKGKEGQGLLLDGDAWLDLEHVGVFKRNNAFSVGLWVKLPEELDEGVIFHKNDGSRLYSFKGYSLYLIDDRLELMLAHTWPENAIIRRTQTPVPRNKWIHLLATYDGSSSAEGLKLYMDGQPVATEILNNNLYKDIVFGYTEDMDQPGKHEPGLQIGARWRGKGIGGAFVDDILVYNRELSAIEVMQIANPDALRSIVNKPSNALSAEDREQLTDHFVAHHSSAYRTQLAQVARARRPLVDSMEQIKEIMVMKEMPRPRQAFVLERGGYENYGEEVFPSTPESILPWNESLNKNRLGLAQWLLDPDHPLTARVAVNRFWQSYFGQGLVKTTEDFGNQGALPSHPRLLDWLATEFINSGWDVKYLQKLIVMSSTYRQNSVGTPELREQDPDNVWLARGPSMRLSSEMVRDNALAASGLINTTIGGRSVRPYQPDGLWNMNGGRYVQDSGEDLYRRSLYVFWKRTVPHPTLQTFDQPERTECTVRRQKTNTPLQALALLNDPTYVEASKAVGEQISRKKDVTAGISEAFRRLTGRKPANDELTLLVQLQEEEYGKFKSDPAKGNGWLEVGEYAIDPKLDRAELAANAVVANVILNSDACITKR